MTREEQYKIFYPFYESEEKRYAELTNRATIFLSVVSGLTLFAGINSDGIVAGLTGSWLAMSFVLTSALCLLGSIAFAVISLRLRDYKDVCDVEHIVVEVEESKFSREDLYSVLLGNLADAVAHNRQENDRRAKWLISSTVLLLIGITAFMALNVIAADLIKGISHAQGQG